MVTRTRTTTDFQRRTLIWFSWSREVLRRSPLRMLNIRIENAADRRLVDIIRAFSQTCFTMSICHLSVVRRAILILCLAGICRCSQAQVGATPASSEPEVARGEVVRFAAGPAGQGEVFRPTSGSPGSWPSIVLVPDSSGLSDFVRRQARDLTAKGYLVLAVDIFNGRTPSNATEANEWVDDFKRHGGTSVLQGAMGFLQNWMADPTKVAVVGWGTGASLAIQLAIMENNVKALVVNYGDMPTDLAALARIQAKILGTFAGQDALVSVDQIENFKKALTSAHKVADVKIYSDAAHNFEDVSDSPAYNAVDAADASQRMTRFLAVNLRGVSRAQR